MILPFLEILLTSLLPEVPGSGDVEEAYSVSLEEGLTGAGFILDKGLKQHYLDYIRAEEAKIDWKKYNHVTPPRIVECTLDEGLIRQKSRRNGYGYDYHRAGMPENTVTGK